MKSFEARLMSAFDSSLAVMLLPALNIPLSPRPLTIFAGSGESFLGD